MGREKPIHTLPHWLFVLSLIALCSGGLSAAILTADVVRHPLRMWIMNIVWPVTGLYAGPLGLWVYYRIGRRKEKPFPQTVALAAMHCGSGCALGDLCAEWLAAGVPLTLFGQKVFAAWSVDFGFAYVLGIFFQYFTIAPMRGLSFRDGLIAASKADTLSLAAWQAGMYGWMAIVHFAVFGEIPVTNPVFWFMMQIAMLCGFATAYPVNWWLVRSGLKEEM